MAQLCIVAFGRKKGNRGTKIFHDWVDHDDCTPNADALTYFNDTNQYLLAREHEAFAVIGLERTG